MTDNTIFDLGAAYGYAQAHLPHILGTPERVSMAAMRPLAAITFAVNTLLRNQKMTPHIDDMIRSALSGVEMTPDKEKVLSLDQQGFWLLGYNKGKEKDKLI